MPEVLCNCRCLPTVCPADVPTAHMTVPNGADDPKLSVAFWPHEEGVPLPELVWPPLALGSRNGLPLVISFASSRADMPAQQSKRVLKRNRECSLSVGRVLGWLWAHIWWKTGERFPPCPPSRPLQAPGQESMVLRDGSTGRDHLCIIPNITATGLPGDEEEEEEELSQSATGGGAGAHTGDPRRGTEGEGEDEEDEEDEEGEAGAKGRMRRWRGRLRRKPPQRGQHHQRPLGQHGSGDLGLGQGQQGGVAEGDTRRSPEELLSALKGLPCSYKVTQWSLTPPRLVRSVERLSIGLRCSMAPRGSPAPTR